MLSHFEIIGDAPGGLQFELMPLPVAERERIDFETLCKRDRQGCG